MKDGCDHHEHTVSVWILHFEVSVYFGHSWLK